MYISCNGQLAHLTKKKKIMSKFLIQLTNQFGEKRIIFTETSKNLIDYSNCEEQLSKIIWKTEPIFGLKPVIYKKLITLKDKYGNIYN